ncbi:hypothetical protein QQY66_13025 [Streptomyces sp. DG2A-72]|uniref:hypothetical protein n=1 Tax=Streptomyces sp. DG2A-72 TaxID=3051386 RepID=UPI00265C35A3|nr:hypothetical protein [Streptomyces sp. DG2A-72]MDO0932576.1 hypothetical protein [Streptomyces sp. DG2A-72]
MSRRRTLASASNDAQTAAESGVCQGLATALGDNERFIAQIKVQQEASGCVVGESAQGSQATQPAQNGQQNAQPSQTATAPAGNAGGRAAASGEQVGNGSTVTLSGEGGAPAASSNQFPAGTRLKVTSLDNNKSTTVEVTSVSGSCALLNNAAFEQVREPGKFPIRRAVIEKVG